MVVSRRYTVVALEDCNASLGRFFLLYLAVSRYIEMYVTLFLRASGQFPGNLKELKVWGIQEYLS